MNDQLFNAARQLGVPTDHSAGPGNGVHGLSIWARWPRHPHEVAQDILNQVTQAEQSATVTPLGGTPLWRARHGEWTHIGRFEDAVAQLALHVSGAPSPSLAGESRHSHAVPRTPQLTSRRN